jgi:hypothetical protein
MGEIQISSEENMEEKMDVDSPQGIRRALLDLAPASLLIFVRDFNMHGRLLMEAT